MGRRFDLGQYRDMDYFKFNSISDFLQSQPKTGIYEISIDGLPLHLRFVNQNSETLFVSFGAVFPSKGFETYPLFTGVGMASKLPANHLSISDPVFGHDGNLRTSWYLGVESHVLQSSLATVIQHFSTAGTPGQIVLFGSSAGGFASIYYGAQLPESASVAVNARVDLTAEPTAFFSFAKRAFPSYDANTYSEAIDVLADVRSGGLRSNVIAFIQNVQDQPYFENNLNPLLDRSKGDPKVWVYLQDSGPGHRLPTGSIMTDTVSTLIQEAPDWAASLRTLDFKNGISSDEAYGIREKLLEQSIDAS